MAIKRCPPCPECGSKLSRVVLGKEGQNGEQLRRRHCEICDFRFYTIQPAEQEIPKSQVDFGPRGTKVKILAIPS
jgi:transcriptional regulator NrdR family protein